MRKEFIRILKQPLITGLYLLLIVLISGLSFLYASRIDEMESYKTPFSLIQPYEFVHEIPERIENMSLFILTLEESDPNYDVFKKLYEDAILFYQFLYDNNIAYDQYAEPNEFQGYQSNPIRFIEFHLELILSLLALFIMVLAISLINYEHSTGVYKFIYGTEEKRLSIIKRKFIVYSLHIAFVLFIICSLLFMFSEAFNPPFDIIIFDWNNKVYGFSIDTYRWLMLGSISLIGIFFAFGFFSAALFAKNIYVSIILCLVFLGVFQGLFFYLDFPYLNAAAQFPANIFQIDVTLNEVTFIYLFKYISVVLLFICALFSFKNRDLN